MHGLLVFDGGDGGDHAYHVDIREPSTLPVCTVSVFSSVGWSAFVVQQISSELDIMNDRSFHE